jgi:hypothetical protein
MTTPKKVYIAHVYSDHSLHAEKIIESNPDNIILWCDAEYEANNIFTSLIDSINDYVITNNKTIKILYPGPDKKITENIYLEKNYGYYLVNHAKIIEKTKDIDFDNVHLQADKLYTLYSNRGSDERLAIIDTFAREKLLDQGVVTFRGGYYLPPSEQQWKYHDGSPLIDEEQCNTHFFTETYPPTDFPKSFFRGFADVVCESRVDNGEFFTTEKTAKSVVAMKPFLVLSSQYYHRHIHNEYGIEPYTEIFDYDFDNSPDVNERIEGIVANIKRLATLDKDEIHSKIFDKLVHNKNQYTKYGTMRNKMVPKYLEAILSEPYELLGDINEIDYWLTLVRKNGWIT